MTASLASSEIVLPSELASEPEDHIARVVNSDYSSAIAQHALRGNPAFRCAAARLLECSADVLKLGSLPCACMHANEPVGCDLDPMEDACLHGATLCFRHRAAQLSALLPGWCLNTCSGGPSASCTSGSLNLLARAPPVAAAENGTLCNLPPLPPRDLLPGCTLVQQVQRLLTPKVRNLLAGTVSRAMLSPSPIGCSIEGSEPPAIVQIIQDLLACAQRILDRGCPSNCRPPPPNPPANPPAPLPSALSPPAPCNTEAPAIVQIFQDLFAWAQRILDRGCPWRTA